MAILINFYLGRYNSIGRVSICDIESYRFESYYLPLILLLKYKNLKNLKINLKKFNILNIFKKMNLKFFFITTCFNKNNLYVYKNIYKKTFFLKIFFKKKTANYSNNLFLLFYQNKITTIRFTTIKTITIGMLLTFLNLLKTKFVRRTLKGYKMLINFLNFSNYSSFFKRFIRTHSCVFFFKNIKNKFFFLKKKF